MKHHENHRMKNRILAVLSAVLCVLMIWFWTGKDENAFSSEEIKQAERISQVETEVLAPNAAMETIDGRDVQMKDLYNKKPVYVFFWMPWSDESKKQLPIIESLYKKYGEQVYFVVVSIGSTKKDAQRFCHQSPYTMPFYTAVIAMASDYNVYEVPLSMMIAKGGTIKSRQTGALTEKELEYLIVSNSK